MQSCDEHALHCFSSSCLLKYIHIYTCIYWDTFLKTFCGNKISQICVFFWICSIYQHNFFAGLVRHVPNYECCPLFLTQEKKFVLLVEFSNIFVWSKKKNLKFFFVRFENFFFDRNFFFFLYPKKILENYFSPNFFFGGRAFKKKLTKKYTQCPPCRGHWIPARERPPRWLFCFVVFFF